MNNCAAIHHGPNSSGTPFRAVLMAPEIIDIVRLRLFGGVFPLDELFSMRGPQAHRAVSDKTDCTMLIISSYAVRSVI